MHRVALATCGLALVAGCATKPPPPDPLGQALARAEQAFADRAAEAGVKVAFLDNLADRSTLFRPGPVDGRRWTSERPDPGIDLRWRPQLVTVSRADDLGFSTGPWRITPKDGGTIGYGQFFTVWTKAKDGRWKVLIDHGIDHPEATGWDRPLESEATDGMKPIEPLMDAEARFNATSSNAGLGDAYMDYGSPAMRPLREGESPQLDAKKEKRIEASVFADDRLWHFTMTDHGTAASGDLGWVMGRYRVREAVGGASASAPASTATPAAPQTGYYVRVWRAERGMWRVLGDVLAPAPLPAR